MSDVKCTGVRWCELPFGRCRLVATAQGLQRIDLPGAACGCEGGGAEPTPQVRRVLDQAERELRACYRGEAAAITVPLDLSRRQGFARRVLEACRRVPRGETVTYGQLAVIAGSTAGAARAVGQVMAHNPLPLVIPCHRVVGSGGRLVGFGGGLELKAWLLDFEKVTPAEERK